MDGRTGGNKKCQNIAKRYKAQEDVESHDHPHLEEIRYIKD